MIRHLHPIEDANVLAGAQAQHVAHLVRLLRGEPHPLAGKLLASHPEAVRHRRRM